MLGIAVLLFMLLEPALTDRRLGPPAYKYRYETADIMNTAASNVPLRGYHVVEGGYYPSELQPLQQPILRGGYGGNYYPSEIAGGLEPGFLAGYNVLQAPQFERPPPIALVNGQALNVPFANGLRYVGDHGFGYVSPGGGGYGPQHLGGYHQAYGGEEMGKSDFGQGKKSFNDERYGKALGRKGEEQNQGQTGFAHKELSSKDVKGDSGHYSTVDGGKRVFEDGKEYHGGHHFNNEGRNGEEKTANQGHKKGHKVKSFKTSHHKDESGKNEEYYDEAHDEGGNFVFKGGSGKFGENAASSFKGGNQEGKYNVEESKKEGHHSSEHSAKEEQADQGKFGGSKFAGNEATFGYKNGADEQSLLGHQEGGKVFKTSPFIAPFHNDY